MKDGRLRTLKRVMVALVWIAVWAALTALALILCGCAGPGSRLGAVDHNRIEAAVEISPDIAAAMVKIETLETAVAAVKVAMGDLTVGVGGGGDSVTAWIYALIAAAAILYPAVWRPLRKMVARRRESDEATKRRSDGD